MTRTRLIAVLLVLTVLLAACGSSKTGTSTVDPTIPELTTETGWVVDTTGKMSADTMSQLQSLTKSVQSDGLAQMGIFIFSDCACETVPFATKVANQNGIGVKGKDNGITVVVFLDKEGSGSAKPSIGVATGSGMEGQLNDAKVGRLLDATFVPSRADGNWEAGLVSFVTATRSVLSGASVDSFKAPPPQPLDIAKVLLFALVVIIGISLDGIFFQFTITRIILLGLLSGGKLGGGGGSSGGGAAR